MFSRFDLFRFNIEIGEGTFSMFLLAFDESNIVFKIYVSFLRLMSSFDNNDLKSV